MEDESFSTFLLNCDQMLLNQENNVLCKGVGCSLLPLPEQHKQPMSKVDFMITGMNNDESSDNDSIYLEESSMSEAAVSCFFESLQLQRRFAQTPPNEKPFASALCFDLPSELDNMLEDGNDQTLTDTAVNSTSFGLLCATENDSEFSISNTGMQIAPGTGEKSPNSAVCSNDDEIAVDCFFRSLQLCSRYRYSQEAEPFATADSPEKRKCFLGPSEGFDQSSLSSLQCFGLQDVCDSDILRGQRMSEGSFLGHYSAYTRTPDQSDSPLWKESAADYVHSQSSALSDPELQLPEITNSFYSRREKYSRKDMSKQFTRTKGYWQDNTQCKKLDEEVDKFGNNQMDDDGVEYVQENGDIRLHCRENMQDKLAQDTRTSELQGQTSTHELPIQNKKSPQTAHTTSCCTVCNIKFRTKYSFARHLLTSLHARRAAGYRLCATVEQRAAEENNLHADSIPAKMNSCDSDTNLTLMTSVHNTKYDSSICDLVLRLKPVQCRICAFVGNSLEELRNHMESKNHFDTVQKASLFCVRCRHAGSCEDMLEHIKTAAHITTVQKSNRPCVIKRYKRHLPQHPLPNKPTGLSCEYCNCCIRSKSSLLIHIRRRHTHERPYLCDICSKSYADKSTLTLHMKSAQHKTALLHIPNHINQN